MILETVEKPFVLDQYQNFVKFVYVLHFSAMNLKKLLSTLSALLLLLPSCKPQTEDNTYPPHCKELLDQASVFLSRQEYDVAMENALKALELSADVPSLKVKALCAIANIDIMTSRDEDAWEKALQAEEIARQHGFKRDLCVALIVKAKLCSYAEISPETGRNEEGLGYIQEALTIARELKDAELEAEASIITGTFYVSFNRWSDPIDKKLYRTAGEWLDRGEAISDSAGIEHLRRNALLVRYRWFQQGGRNEEALEYFANARKEVSPEDHYMASALADRLVRLYTRVGDSESALKAHDDYVREIIRYMTQKSDVTLSEMETRFKVQEQQQEIERRGYKNSILILMILLSVAVISLLMSYLLRARRRNAELQKINDTKEQIIDILTRDLKSPAGAQASALDQLSADALKLSPEEIRSRCQDVAQSARTMNQDVANYVGDILIERSRRIADLGLSKREVEIIRLTADGMTASQIAEHLHISMHTVNTHRQHIYSKMKVRNLNEMLRTASELGIV